MERMKAEELDIKKARNLVYMLESQWEKRMEHYSAVLLVELKECHRDFEMVVMTAVSKAVSTVVWMAL